MLRERSGALPKRMPFWGLASRLPATRLLRAAAGTVMFGLASVPTALARSADPLELRGMTFVASREGRTELVVEAARALLDPDADSANLEQVHVRVSDGTGEDGLRLEMTCDRGEFDLERNDFVAEGNVKGRTGDGRHFVSPWVRYDSEQGLAYTDAEVEIVDGATTFRGAGLRYHVRDGRLQLLDATLVQNP